MSKLSLPYWRRIWMSIAGWSGFMRQRKRVLLHDILIMRRKWNRSSERISNKIHFLTLTYLWWDIFRLLFINRYANERNLLICHWWTMNRIILFICLIFFWLTKLQSKSKVTDLNFSSSPLICLLLSYYNIVNRKQNVLKMFLLKYFVFSLLSRKHWFWHIIHITFVAFFIQCYRSVGTIITFHLDIYFGVLLLEVARSSSNQ